MWSALATFVTWLLDLIFGNRGPSDAEKLGQAEQANASDATSLGEIKTSQAIAARESADVVRDPGSLRAPDPDSRD